MKHLHQRARMTIALGLALLASSASRADAAFTPDTAMLAYNNRTFLPDSDISVWRSSIESILGAYVYQSGDALGNAGRPTGLPVTPKKVDLKSSIVFQSTVAGESELEGSIAGFLKAGRSKSTMDEITVEEIVSITDDTVNLTWCQANTPPVLSTTTRYWCVSGVTLSKVTINRFVKSKKLAEGNYGIVTAKGTWQKDQKASGEYYRANVSLQGPFVNKVHVPAVPFMPPIKQTATGSIPTDVNKNFPLDSSTDEVKIIPTGLERATIPFK